MEELDIVDAHGSIVGKATRDEVHKKKLLHRGISIMLFNTEGELFVQQRSPQKDTYPGLWEGSLSGHVQSGETPHQAAVRELHEELGICIPPSKVKEVLRFGFHEEQERILVTLYVVKDFKGEPILDKEEVRSGSFWAFKKVLSELAAGKKQFHPVFKKALALFLELDGQPREYVPTKK